MNNDEMPASCHDIDRRYFATSQDPGNHFSLLKELNGWSKLTSDPEQRILRGLPDMVAADQFQP